MFLCQDRCCTTSHQRQGWETFTDAVIKKVSETQSHVVFLLWGGPARSKKKLIDTSKHLVLESVHPSPLSANRGGWFGNHHFSRCNAWLEQQGLEPIKCKDEEIISTSAEIARYTGDSYGELKSPFIHFPDSNAMEHETVWTCVELGSYPQAEVLASATTAVDDYALDADNTIIDATLYATLLLLLLLLLLL